jgi:hypothetical protein
LVEKLYAVEKPILLVAGAVVYLVGLVLTGINTFRTRSDTPLIARLEVPSRMLK